MTAAVGGRSVALVGLIDAPSTNAVTRTKDWKGLATFRERIKLPNVGIAPTVSKTLIYFPQKCYLSATVEYLTAVVSDVKPFN